MGWFYCTKHKKITLGYSNSDDRKKQQVSLNCGHTLNKELSKKYRVHRKITHTLADGTPIKKISQPTQWIIQEDKK